MGTIEVNGCRYAYDDVGGGEQTIVFAHGLAMSRRMYDAQVAAFSDRYRCIAFDWRGQGGSEVTKAGYGMNALTFDAVRLIEELDAAPCHWVGLSMGGFVGLRIASWHGDLLRSLTLIDTSAHAEPQAAVPKYRAFAFVNRWVGPRPLLRVLEPLFFGETFRADPAREAERERWRRHFLALDRLGASRATQGVIDRDGVLDHLPRIDVPTLVLHGEEDQAIEIQRSHDLADLIDDARHEVIPRAGHSSTVENPEAVTAALERFLASVVSPRP